MYSFGEIKGNEQLIKNFKSAIKFNKVSHAYILSGEDGSGKMLMAKAFAKALLCETNTGCGGCVACRTFENGNNPDVFYPIAVKTKTIGVDDIRTQVIETVDIKPYKYKYKVYIIDKADTMTIAAQNAFLKTLEEPPAYAVFILLAENINLFLPTILSRCVTFKMGVLDNGIVAEFMTENYGTLRDEADFLAEYSMGSIGKAIKLGSDENFLKLREYITERLFNIRSRGLAEVIGWGKELKTEFGPQDEIFDIMYLWFRDLLAAKSLNDKKYIIQKDKAAKIFAQSKKESFESLTKAINAVWEGKKLHVRNVNFQLTVETVLMKIKEN